MWTESNTPSKIEGAGGADVPKALIYENIRQNAKGKRFAGTLWRIFE